MMPVSQTVGRPLHSIAAAMPQTEPFRSAEEAWFWTVGALRARHEGASSERGAVPRPCDPDDVMKCIDRLYRNGRVELTHARVMRLWGERQEVPGGGSSSAIGDVQLWREAMERLEWPLRAKGIVA